MYIDTAITLLVGLFFIVAFLALGFAGRGPSPSDLLILAAVILPSVASASRLFFEHRRLVRLGWGLSWREALWWMGRSPWWRLRKLVPYDEFRMTPSYHPDRPRVWNLQVCIQLRKELEKEWARQAKVDVALDWVAERRSAEKSEEGSRKESEGV